MWRWSCHDWAVIIIRPSDDLDLLPYMAFPNPSVWWGPSAITPLGTSPHAICLIQVHSFECIKQARKSGHRCTRKDSYNSKTFSWEVESNVGTDVGLNVVLDLGSDPDSGVKSNVGSDLRSDVEWNVKLDVKYGVPRVLKCLIWNVTSKSITQWVSQNDLCLRC